MVGEALAGLIEPFLIHADEYKLDERAFAEDLKEHLGMLRYALGQIKPRKISHINPKKTRLAKTIPNQLKHGEAPRGERENRIGKGGLGEIVGGASWLSSFSSYP